MSTSSVPKLTFAAAGLIVPSESDILAGVQADIDAAFGGGLNPALETPQGQIASSLSAIIGDKNNEFALMVNQVDPRFADGRFQDAIGRIYFLTRKPATPTVVMATLGGLPGTLIPAGTLARDTSDNTYILIAAATIGAGSTVNAEFENEVDGPVPCATGTLTQVYQAVPGWDTITNAADGVLGRNVESRAEFETRRKNSVALNAQGSLAAIYAAVFAVDDVTDTYVAENTTGAPVAIGATAYSLVAHSIFVAAVGGTDAAVAEAIWKNKNAGCDYNGTTQVSVVDQSGYSFPYPTYTVKFLRPAALPIKFAVSIVADSALPTNVVDQIKTAIIAKFNGTDGTGRERIGGSIFASRYHYPVASLSPNIAILSLLVGTVTATLGKVDVGVDTYPTISAADIAVTLV